MRFNHNVQVIKLVLFSSVRSSTLQIKNYHSLSSCVFVLIHYMWHDTGCSRELFFLGSSEVDISNLVEVNSKWLLPFFRCAVGQLIWHSCSVY